MKLVQSAFEKIIKIHTFILFCLQILIKFLKRKDNILQKTLACIRMRPPGIEVPDNSDMENSPGSSGWKPEILTTILRARFYIFKISDYPSD